MGATESLFKRAEEFGETSYELVKLIVTDKIAEASSSLISKACIVIAAAIFIIVLTIGGALWLGDLLGKSYYGFFCIAGIYALLAFVLHFFLQYRIKDRVSGSIISHILNPEDHEQNN